MSEEAIKIAPVTGRMVVGRTSKGSPSFNCGDPVAAALVGLTIEQVRLVAWALGVGFDENGDWKYGTSKNGKPMSNGHQRMVIGHVFRGLVRKHDRERQALERAAAVNGIELPYQLQTGEGWFRGVVAKVLSED